MIRVGLADDQHLVRQGLRSLLDLVPDVEVVAEATDGHEALRLLRDTPLDVALLDFRMPGLTGVQVLEELAGRGPPTLLLTTFDDDSVAIAALAAGARGFLLKDVSFEQLVEALRCVASGGSLVLPAVSARVLRGLDHLRPHFASAPLPDPLTAREVEVLRLMASGSSNREIGRALGTAEGTVKNQASSILSKLGVRDRTRAVLRALELGVI